MKESHKLSSSQVNRSINQPLRQFAIVPGDFNVMAEKTAYGTLHLSGMNTEAIIKRSAGHHPRPPMPTTPVLQCTRNRATYDTIAALKRSRRAADMRRLFARFRNPSPAVSRPQTLPKMLQPAPAADLTLGAVAIGAPIDSKRSFFLRKK